MRAKLIVASVSIAAMLGAAACTTTDPYSSAPRRNNTGTGAIAGAVGGALLGYLTNTSSGEQGRKNALIGAGIGALGGARFLPVLDDVARVLNEYDRSMVDVVGHTDSSGGDAINQPLSERRASSVASYLIDRGVMRERIYVAGMSARNPIASNDTVEGKAQNRRVEILIRPFTG